LSFDFQKAGFVIKFQFAEKERTFSDQFSKASNYFQNLKGSEEKLKYRLIKSIEFLQKAENIVPGTYTVVLSPEAAGIFAHESIGHFSEADFFNESSSEKSWKIGKRTGSKIISIIDDGNQPGLGFTPFDDEGTKSKPTFLIRDGIFFGRLHNASTAAAYGETLTGNARAVNFSYEPIIRMTSTYVKEGTKSLYELISTVDKGILVVSMKGGTGMSTFSLAPSLAYMIRKGTIAEPVMISVISGDVNTTLKEIDGVSDNVELSTFINGGCGKLDQYPLTIGFGGPYVRVKKMDVR